MRRRRRSGNLPDYELLLLMLFASNPRAKVESLAAQLCQRFGGLAKVLGANPAELAAAGLGVSAIAAVQFVREFALRFMRAELRDRPIVGSWDKLIDYCTAHIAYSTVEEFHILFLDRKNALIRERAAIARDGRSHAGLYARGHQTFS
jgi:DNA repair protein RadC